MIRYRGTVRQNDCSMGSLSLLESAEALSPIPRLDRVSDYLSMEALYGACHTSEEAYAGTRVFLQQPNLSEIPHLMVSGLGLSCQGSVFTKFLNLEQLMLNSVETTKLGIELPL
jgi:hypothetical protein